MQTPGPPRAPGGLSSLAGNTRRPLCMQKTVEALRPSGEASHFPNPTATTQTVAQPWWTATTQTRGQSTCPRKLLLAAWCSCLLLDSCCLVQLLAACCLVLGACCSWLEAHCASLRLGQYYITVEVGAPCGDARVSNLFVNEMPFIQNELLHGGQYSKVRCSVCLRYSRQSNAGLCRSWGKSVSFLRPQSN